MPPERRYAPYQAEACRRARRLAGSGGRQRGAWRAPGAVPRPEASLDTDAEGLAGTVPEGEPKTQGIALGQKAAAGIIALRAKDGIDAAESYRPVTTAGVYVPTVIPVSSTIGQLTPWVMSSGSQFRPAPPPALNSPTWTAISTRSARSAAATASKRTAEQTEIGKFWFADRPADSATRSCASSRSPRTWT